jgi:transcriptional regulator with XRE-family HTH domain
MKGYELIKEKRIEKGWSVIQLAQLADISRTALNYYESGEDKIESIPVYKCIVIFGLLDLSITDFFEEYYKYKEEMDTRISEWKNNNPIDYNYLNVKRKLKSRISQIKRRGCVKDDDLEEILEVYYRFLEINNSKYKASDELSIDDYKEFVMPINYKITSLMDYIPDSITGRIIIDALHKTWYKLTDVASLCGITRQHLNNYVNGKFDFKQMRTDTALRICYLLDVDFDYAFCVEKTI